MAVKDTPQPDALEQLTNRVASLEEAVTKTKDTEPQESLQPVKDVLEALEWSAKKINNVTAINYSVIQCCPQCWASWREGHTASCPLAAAIHIVSGGEQEKA